MFSDGLSPAYRDALATSHQVAVSIQVWQSLTDSMPLEPDLPFSGGQVSATLTSRVASRLTLQVNRELFPATPGGLLAPFGNQIRAWRGIRYSDERTIWFPVFTGRINIATTVMRGVVCGSRR
jgi:hypothetical protein